MNTDQPRPLEDIQPLQETSVENPYSITARLQLAEAYQNHGYPDLAVGEAYIALLLVDECLGETGEFEDEAYEAALKDYSDRSEPASEHEDTDERSRILERVGGAVKNTIYLRLVENLLACNNLKQAHGYLKTLCDDTSTEVELLQQKLSEVIKTKFKDAHGAPEPDEYPEWGRVKREVYAWNNHEPDRSSPDSLTALNDLLATTAPNLEARITELPDLTNPEGGGVVKQIGLFAKDDIVPGEEILSEKSILTATARMNDTFCDACAAKLPGLSAVENRSQNSSAAVSCPECEETIFCSDDCFEAAQDLYHPALCGMDTESLAKDASAKEAADSLYALLLLRTFALASHQDIHPLDLIQTKFLWGDFIGSEPSLPFNLHYNIVLPLTMLEKMEINIFTSSHHFNPWTFNTLYAKFRGTADARQGPDGKPEIGAVHPLWCLANHSCDPNVRWEWEGRMKFWVRKESQLADWRPNSGVRAGLKRNEEILGHYCDIELPVKERREWAKGALGGDCMCERCTWEAAHPEKTKTCRISK